MHYAFETSPELQSWTSVLFGFNEEGPYDQASMVATAGEHTVYLVMEGEKAFVRIVVSS